MTSVQSARKLIDRGRDLFPYTDGHLIAIRQLGWRTHTFRDDEGPKQLVRIAVAIVDGAEADVISVLEVGWTRVLRLLEMTDPDSWQVGRLWRDEANQGAVSLEPPLATDDVVRAAALLERLEAAALTKPEQQLALSVGEQQRAVDEEMPPPPPGYAAPHDDIPY